MRKNQCIYTVLINDNDEQQKLKMKRIFLHFVSFYVAHLCLMRSVVVFFNQKQLKRENEDGKMGERVMDLQTHLSSRESSGTLIQIIDMWSESLEVWDDKLLSEGLSEQDNVALNAPDEQTTNNMAKILWLHVDEGKSLPTRRATRKSDKLRWSDWWSFILVWCIMWSYDKNKQVQGQIEGFGNIYHLLFPEQEESRGLINTRSTNISWLLLSFWRQEEQSVLELKHLVTFGLLYYSRHPVMLSVLPLLINPIWRNSDFLLRGHLTSSLYASRESETKSTKWWEKW